MKYIFGPVPSRRLGRSLGIDPTPALRLAEREKVGPYAKPAPQKTCNWNCIYCQLGRTRPFTRKRSSLFPPEELLAELRTALDASPPGAIDWITFVGAGEPTLNSDLGSLIRGAKGMTSLPVAVITNGSLLGEADVSDALCAADAVLPTLDAGSPGLFRRINRPPAEMSFGQHVHGLASFRHIYTGQLWVEVMLLEGFNDSEEALGDIASALKEIHPDAVHLLLPTRPPAESYIRPADEAGLTRARNILGSVACVLMPDERRGGFVVDRDMDILDAIGAILVRHPLNHEELARAFREAGIVDVEPAIKSLIESGRATMVEGYGTCFYRGI